MKRQAITVNKHKYSISVTYKLLKIARQTYYYQTKTVHGEAELEAIIEEKFHHSCGNDDTRKLK